MVTMCHGQRIVLKQVVGISGTLHNHFACENSFQQSLATFETIHNFVEVKNVHVDYPPSEKQLALIATSTIMKPRVRVVGPGHAVYFWVVRTCPWNVFNMSQNECLSPGIGVILDFVAGCAWQVQCIVRVSSKYGRSNASMCELQQNDCAKQYGGLPFMILLGPRALLCDFVCVRACGCGCVCVSSATHGAMLIVRACVSGLCGGCGLSVPFALEGPSRCQTFIVSLSFLEWEVFSGIP